MIETPNIIRPEPRRGHVEGEKFTERPRSSARGQTPTSMMRRWGVLERHSFARRTAQEYQVRREVPANPWQRVAKRIADLPWAYGGPLSIPRRCPLSAVKQRCGSASPGLNRVFRLLPQRLEVLLHQWPRPTDLPRVRCVGRGLDSRQRC